MYLFGRNDHFPSYWNLIVPVLMHSEYIWVVQKRILASITESAHSLGYQILYHWNICRQAKKLLQWLKIYCNFLLFVIAGESFHGVFLENKSVIKGAIIGSIRLIGH